MLGLENKVERRTKGQNRPHDDPEVKDPTTSNGSKSQHS